MADRTLTINHADGDSETYTLKTEDVLGVRSMSVDGETVTIDRTAPDLVRTIIADGQTITIDTTREGVRTLTVDGTEITIDRSEESNLDSFLQQFTGASAAYSLRDLASNSGNTTVVRVRRSSDNAEADFKAKEVSDGTLVTWVGAGNDGFVPTWYDQSGNGNDATQSVAGSQPKIVDAGVLVSGGLAFDGGQMLRTADTFLYPTGTTLSTFITNKASNNTTGYLFRFQSDYLLWRYFGNRRVSAGTNANAGAVSLNEELWSVISNLNTSGGTSNFYVDGTLAADPDKAHGSNDVIPARKIEIGGTPTSTFWIGTVNEIIIYPSDQSTNRVAIETNINNQYDIY